MTAPERGAPAGAAPPGPGGGARARWRAILAVAAGLLLAAGGLAARRYLTRGEEETDDAHVEADVVALAPRVGGVVAQVLAADDAHVAAGEPLLRIDDADLRARVEQAEAAVAAARAQEAVAAARAAAAGAEAARDGVASVHATDELARADLLAQGEVLSPQAHDRAREASASARAEADAAGARLRGALAEEALSRASARSAGAALELAALQRSYAVLRAPAAGVVSHLSARVGQVLEAGQAVGQLVPDRRYVVANFKETQTGSIRVGQRVEVQVDAFPGRRLPGRVESIAAGTGARFALLPADDASGNFVKVVQRVPVRITLLAQPADLPLRAGLSACVTVDTLGPASEVRQTDAGPSRVRLKILAATIAPATAVRRREVVTPVGTAPGVARRQPASQPPGRPAP